MKKITLLLFFISIYTTAWSQKIKDDTQKHILKTYPAVNLPETIKSYAVRITFSNNNKLIHYSLEEGKLRKLFLNPNTLVYDSLGALLIMDIFIEMDKPLFSTGSSVAVNNQVTYYANTQSMIKGDVSISLNGKIFAYKRFNFPVNNPFNSPTNQAYPNELWVSDTCATLDSKTSNLPAGISEWINYATGPATPSTKAIKSADALQITKLYKASALFFKEQVDINFPIRKSRYYTVKYKEKDVSKIDSAYTAIIKLLDDVTLANYKEKQITASGIIKTFSNETTKFAITSENEKSVVWALSMDLATAGDFADDYKLVASSLALAEQTGYEKQETEKLRRFLSERLARYNARYNSEGKYLASQLAIIDRKSSKEQYEIDQTIKAQRELDSLETELKGLQQKYKYLIEKKRGEVLYKTGAPRTGFISFNPDLMSRAVNNEITFDNKIVFEYKDDKGIARVAEYSPNEIVGFAIDGEAFYESMMIEMSADQKLMKLGKEQKRFYRTVYTTQKIYLYRYESNRAVQYAFKLTGQEMGYCMGYGSFRKNPNAALAELLKASPEVAAKVASSDISIFEEETLKQLFDEYAKAIK